MSSKTIVFLCIQVFMAHVIFAHCTNSASGHAHNLSGRPKASSLTSGVVKTGMTMGAPKASVNAGGFTVTSSSPIAPSGVQVVSEYVVEGPLTVGGQLPVLSGVAVDGQVPSSGTAGTAYGCGSGKVAISEADLTAANISAKKSSKFSRSSKCRRH